MSEVKELSVPAKRKYLAVIREFISEHANAAGASQPEVDSLIQAVDEAASNTIIHGYKDGPGEIVIEVKYSETEIIVTLRDSAPAFDPTQAPKPNLDLPLDERPVGGLGIHLIRHCVDEIRHSEPSEGGNTLVLVKHIREPDK
jgi:serine/threonine-protein kinase RsbW